MKRTLKILLEWLKTIGMAIAIAMVIENLLFSFAVVNGESMAPTLATEDRLLVAKASFLREDFKVGDLVIFNPPSKEDEVFIKRVIAMENDHFSILNGEVYINGEKIKEEYIYPETYLDRRYRVLEGIVPEGMVFVLGDNRNDSNDSRSFGFVHRDNIKGRVLLKVWPMNELKAFISFD